MSRQRGFSLTEVMVMMVILSVSLVGIYSLVTSGQKLAAESNNRLMAVNLARDGIESVISLRDTFLLKKLPTATDTFFSIDAGYLGGSNSLNVDQTYILDDARHLTSSSDFSVCLNEYGWFSQESFDNSATTCTSTTTPLCSLSVTTSCRTRLKRKIFFKSCDEIPEASKCLQVSAQVWWGDNSTDSKTSLTLTTLLTRS